MKEIVVQEEGNRLVIHKDRKTEEEFIKAVGDAVMFLLNEDYKLKVWQEDSSMVFIDYTWGEAEFGTNVCLINYNEEE